MRTLYQTLEQLALELPCGDFGQAPRVVALIFQNEILYLPWSDRQAVLAKLDAPRAFQHLVALVLREMQRHARVILREQAHVVEHEGKPLSRVQAALVQSVWDRLGTAPAWTAFASQINKLAKRYAEEES